MDFSLEIPSGITGIYERAFSVNTYKAAAGRSAYASKIAAIPQGIKRFM
jgi:hypothetical protein